MTNLLVVDLGNTRAKWAMFPAITTSPLPEPLCTGVWEYATPDMASLGPPTPTSWALVEVNPQPALVSAITQWAGQLPLICTPLRPAPLTLNYTTPHTLGADRFAAAVAADALVNHGHALVIDLGTAITYDAVSEGHYRGGAISPGLRLRYQALHDYTARLPLLEPLPPEHDPPWLGTSTETSLRAGVEGALVAELQGMILQYQRILGPQLRVILTGGDALRFENRLNTPIFVAPSLVLQGACLLLIASFRD